MTERHVHHWTVESPNGPTSIGTCECGEEREFENSLPIDRVKTHGGAYRLMTSRKTLDKLNKEEQQ